MRGRGAVVGVLVLTLGALGPAPAAAGPDTAGVTGTVTGPDGEPVAGLCVEVYGEEYSLVVTDEAGAYRVDGLTPGGHLVAFNACPDATTGFAAEFFDDAAGFTDATPVSLAAGETRSGIDAALEPAARISGTVTDEVSRAALEGTCVVALEFEQGLFAVARTGADGGYTVGNLRGGEYVVGFGDCSDPFNHVSELYDDLPLDLPLSGTPLQPEPATVQVEDGGSAEGVDAALTEGGSLVGTVTARHTGRPADFVCVGLFEPDSEPTEFTGVTSTGLRPDGAVAPGGYVFSGVRPGDYVVGFNPEVCGDDGYDTGWAEGRSSRADADVLTVRRGEATAGIDAVVSPRPSISAVCFRGEPGGFSDVPDDSAHADAIGCLADLGIATGRGDGTYRPGEPVRREQMAGFLAGALRVLGVELPASPPDAFRDDDASVHERAVDQLAALGVVGGKADGRYGPAEPVSRAQTAAFLVRAYERATGVPLLAPDDAYADDDGTTHEPSIDRASTAGLAAGTGPRAFGPAADVRRDQMATFVARLVDRVVRDTDDGLLFFSSSATVSGSEGPLLRNAPADRLALQLASSLGATAPR